MEIDRTTQLGHELASIEELRAKLGIPSTETFKRICTAAMKLGCQDDAVIVAHMQRKAEAAQRTLVQAMVLFRCPILTIQPPMVP